jgi:hypothetical protein
LRHGLHGLSMCFSHESIEVLRPIDRIPAPGGIRPDPPIGTEARSRVSFCLFPEVVYRAIGNRDACAFNDGVPDAQDPRGPRVVALECCRGGKGDQCVHEACTGVVRVLWVAASPPALHTGRMAGCTPNVRCAR